MPSFPLRDKALAQLGAHVVVQEHDDGDLTVRVGEKLYVVTTDGKVFEESRVAVAAAVPTKTFGGYRMADTKYAETCLDCIVAGAAFGESVDKARRELGGWERVAAYYRNYAQGKLKDKDLKLRESTFTQEMGIVGSTLLSWALTKPPRTVAVTFMQRSKCMASEGFAHELLSPALLKYMASIDSRWIDAAKE